MKSTTHIIILAFGLAFVLSGSSKENSNSSSNKPPPSSEPSPSKVPHLTYSNEDASAFIDLFNKKDKSNSDKNKLRQLRREIYEQTVKIVDAGYYYSTKTESKVKLRIDKFYNTKLPPISPHDVEEMKVEVKPLDTFLAGKELLDEGMNPVILNFANAKTSGGGVTNGAGAQEENLFRRSDYVKSLRTTEQKIYGDFEAHYNPNIIVFRAQENEGYALLEEDEMFSVSGIAVAAPECRKHKTLYLEGGEVGANLSPLAKDIFANKIKTILRVAHANGHDSVVLGALGAGAFGCHPGDVATIFKNILKTSEFNTAFKKVVFAILNDHNGGDLFTEFNKVLSA